MMTFRLILAAAAFAALAACSPGATTKTEPAAAPDPAATVARGKYLVDNIGLCGDCHTQRLPTGMLDSAHYLEGATLVFKPSNPQPWAPTTPALAGLPKGYDEAQFVRFLQTNVKPDGSRPLPPMPEYKLSEEDATAIAAYLKGLPPAP